MKQQCNINQTLDQEARQTVPETSQQLEVAMSTIGGYFSGLAKPAERCPGLISQAHVLSDRFRDWWGGP